MLPSLMPCARTGGSVQHEKRETCAFQRDALGQRADEQRSTLCGDCLAETKLCLLLLLPHDEVGSSHGWSLQGRQAVSLVSVAEA